MNTDKNNSYKPVDASPVKSFFVSMLTRDIRLEEAIMDLLDNCVDGILRSKTTLSGKTPYKGYSAKIEFSKDSFLITDNCGGIPWSVSEYAFRMGRSEKRPTDAPGTVGVYGIGMKRAIFKMGRDCLISTQNQENRYEIEITPSWIDDEDIWDIPVKQKKKALLQDGTTILIGNLYEGISKTFGEDAISFKTKLERMVATHYAFIIEKGFEVWINNEAVIARPTKLVYEKSAKTGIKPFIFKAKIEDVDVFLTVGFTRPIPSQDDAASEQEETQYSSLDAGWTILCNDRAVLYCDRTELTGWGEATVPRYHTQFIAISGIVEFKSDNPAALPTTTTKRGIEASSLLYLQVKNKMREGMLIFTDYTNKWKGRADESKRHMETATPLSLEEIKAESASLQFNAANRGKFQGRQFKPALPLPAKLEARKRRISYVKEVEEIKRVAQHLFNDVDTEPSVVGEKCFDLFLKEAGE